MFSWILEMASFAGAVIQGAGRLSRLTVAEVQTAPGGRVAVSHGGVPWAAGRAAGNRHRAERGEPACRDLCGRGWGSYVRSLRRVLKPRGLGPSGQKTWRACLEVPQQKVDGDETKAIRYTGQARGRDRQRQGQDAGAWAARAEGGADGRWFWAAGVPEAKEPWCGGVSTMGRGSRRGNRFSCGEAESQQHTCRWLSSTIATRHVDIRGIELQREVQTGAALRSHSMSSGEVAAAPA